jgi:hypothetical protein
MPLHGVDLTIAVTQLTNCRESSPECESSSCSASLKNFYHFTEPTGSLPCSHEPAASPTLSQINHVHTLPFYTKFLILILILSSHLCLCLLISLFPSCYLSSAPVSWHPPNDLCDSKRGSTNRQPQLNLYQFHFVLHVSSLVKSQHQAIKNVN